MVIGVELEVDSGGYDDYNAKEVLEIANKNGEDRLYINSDGSLNDGFELVSHPMTLLYHKNEMPWDKIMKRLIHMGYKSHQAGTCGLHCHVSRAALGDCYEKQEEATARILYFVEHHWDEILKFSRRTAEQMDRWAARYGNKGKPKKLYDDIKKGYSSRYRAVNISMRILLLQNAYDQRCLTTPKSVGAYTPTDLKASTYRLSVRNLLCWSNYSTIEFRMFRGTLKYNTFIATLQFVNEICNVAVSLSDEEMETLTWEQFISRLTKEDHSKLITYLKERNLYTKGVN